MWGGAAAPIRTVHPSIGDPTHLLEDGPDEPNTPPCTAVHLQRGQATLKGKIYYLILNKHLLIFSI